MRNYRKFKNYHIERLRNPEDAKMYLSVAHEDYKENKDIDAFLLAVKDVAEAQGNMSNEYRGSSLDDLLKEIGIFEEVSALTKGRLEALQNGETVELEDTSELPDKMLKPIGGFFQRLRKTLLRQTAD